MIKKLFYVIFSLFPVFSNCSYGKELLYINLMFSTGKQRDVFSKLSTKFQKENQNIQIIQEEDEQEVYKKKFKTYIYNQDLKHDILFWFSGKKMDFLIKKNLVQPLDENFIKNSFTESSVFEVTHEGKIYAMPLSYYQWGFYYNKKLFYNNNLQIPKTWDEFLNICYTLKLKGITPIALAGKQPWTLASWFDYLDLRINGIEFHKNLLNGKYFYTDKRVKKVFTYWKNLLDAGYFTKNALELEWRSVLPDIYRENSAMYLIGNFVIDKIPDEMIDIDPSI